MSTTIKRPDGSVAIDPDLLRACASVLANAPVYGEAKIEALRESARHVVAARGWPDPMRMGGLPPVEHCDAMARHHLESVRGYARSRRQAVRDVARAILDATPDLLVWWCSTLASAVEEPR